MFLHEHDSKGNMDCDWGRGMLGLLIVGSRGLIVGNWLGDFLALMCAVIMAGFFTIVRGRRTVNLIPATGFGLLLAALVASPFAIFPEMSASQWVYLIIGAGFILPVALGITDARPPLYPSSRGGNAVLTRDCIGPAMGLACD